MALPTLPHPQVLVTLGVDTHADSHVAAALDQAGRPRRVQGGRTETGRLAAKHRGRPRTLTEQSQPNSTWIVAGILVQ